MTMTGKLGLVGIAQYFERPLDWMRDKCRVRQFADNKNRPGTDYPTKEGKPGSPVHRNHQRRLIKAIADLNISAKDLPEGCRPEFNIKGCETGRIPSNHENQANTPKETNEPQATT